MANQNPYAAPRARVIDVVDVPAGEGEFIRDGRKVEFRRGFAWFSEAWKLFGHAPGTWIGMVLVLFLISVGLGFVPLIGPFVNYMLGPVFSAGLLLAAQSAAKQEQVEIGQLFAGFQNQASTLILLGLLFVLAWIIVGIGAVGVFFALGGFFAIQELMGGDFSTALIVAILGAVLVGLILATLAAMAMWFAPALVLLHEFRPVDAMRSSFAVCAKNLGPLTAFGLLAVALAVAAIIPFGLGLLVFAPLVTCASYCAYRDLYFR